MLREETPGSRIRASRAKSRRGDLAPATRRQRPKPAIRACSARCGLGGRRWREAAACRPMSCCTIRRSTASPPRARHAGAAPRHPRHRRQEARALRRRADRAGEGRPKRGMRHLPATQIPPRRTHDTLDCLAPLRSRRAPRRARVTNQQTKSTIVLSLNRLRSNLDALTSQRVNLSCSFHDRYWL